MKKQIKSLLCGLCAAALALGCAGCGGRSGKRLPWLKQAAASASAPVSVHAVLLTDNGDERLCPREYAGNRN